MQELSDFPASPSGKSQQEESCITPLCNSASGIYILTRIFGKYVTGSANFLPSCPFLSGGCFSFLNIHAEMIYAGYIRAAPGKPHTVLVNEKFHQIAGKLNFHRMKGKNPLIRVSLALLKGVFCRRPKQEAPSHFPCLCSKNTKSFTPYCCNTFR